MGHTIQGSVAIPRPRAEVFALLTDAAALRQWFAQDAEVDLAAGRYSFWGRHTPDCPGPGDQRQALLSAVPGERLIYSWELHGGATTVEIQLADADGGAHLTLTHSGLSDRPVFFASLQDMWSCALENLRLLALRGRAAMLPDFTPGRGDVYVSAEIDAVPEQVWPVLMDPATLDRFFGEKTVIEPRVGGRYDFGWGSGGPVEILNLDPPRKLAYSWVYQGDGEPPASVVAWTLEDLGGRTRLSLAHTGFAPDRPNEDYRVGWTTYIVIAAALLELGADWNKLRFSGPPLTVA